MKYLAVFLLLLISSCSKVDGVLEDFDLFSFEFSGGTLFSKPGIVTTKEVHFDSGKLLGRLVIIEGKIVSFGKYGTHLVLSDDSGRMLVVLTHLEEVDEMLKGVKETDGILRVLGSVERGKKGMPYLLAKSLNSSN